MSVQWRGNHGNLSTDLPGFRVRNVTRFRVRAPKYRNGPEFPGSLVPAWSLPSLPLPAPPCPSGTLDTLEYPSLSVETMENSGNNKLPIVYHPHYNITFFGLEAFMQRFDTNKYGKIFSKLISIYNISLEDVYQPEGPVADEDLEEIHTKAYLQSLNQSSTFAQVAEAWPLAYFPNWLLQWIVLSPIRLMTAGTLLAAELALERGWAINLGGKILLNTVIYTSIL
jgi:hypothetical protein